MDNGHQRAIFSKVEPKNDLNEEDWQKSLEISAPVDLPSPDKINQQITQDFKHARVDDFNGDTSARLGEIISVDSSEINRHIENPSQNNLVETRSEPSVSEISPDSSPVAAQETNNSFNPMNLHTTGDRLDKNSVIEVDSAINELNQTGNLSNFYDEIRNMTEVNLSNSFNRKLYDKDNKEGNI